MKGDDIQLWDWQRILIGDVPLAFMLEVVIRIAVVYLILMVSMRMLGKRMAAQLTRNELAAMVSLAAGIGVPILTPDRGLLPAIVIAVIVVSVSKLISARSAKNQKVESSVLGRLSVLVADSVMDVRSMTKNRISRERIMAELRSQAIIHLGEVERVYLEANGNFTVVKRLKASPGLMAIPEVDSDWIQKLTFDENLLVCYSCGSRNMTKNKSATCSNCQTAKWVHACVT
jgi:uncharacterized membrane protein YcaP (DUF421 family)